MLKKLRALLAVGIMVSLMTITPTASAWVKPGENNPDKPSSWCQGCHGDHDGQPLGILNGNGSLSKAGCAQFSLTSIIKKATKKSGYNVMSMREDQKKLHAAGQPMMFLPGGAFLFDLSGITPASDGKVKFVQRIAGSHSISDLKAIWDRGHIAMFGVIGSRGWVDSHWVIMDYFDSEGKLHINDSGWPTTVFDGYPQYGNKVGTIYEFAMADGSSFKDAVHLDTMEGGNSSDSSTESSSDTGDGTLLTDADLEGMPPFTEGQLAQIAHSGTGDAEKIAPPPTIEALSTIERSNIQDIVESQNLDKQLHFKSTAGGAVAFIGILFMFYALVVMIAYSLDVTVNTDSSALRFVTLNQFALRESEADPAYYKGTHYLTPGQLLWRVGVLVLIGALCTTSAVVEFMQWVYWRLT